jgi:hypothetical protein
MNRKQLNQTGMGNTVSAYMAKNNTIWSGNVAMTATVSDLNTAIATTSGKAQMQETPTSGAEDQKQQVRHDYEDEILRIAHQLSALAAKNNDANLGAQTELTLPQLDKMSDDILENEGKRISGLATANLAALADYGIVAADVTGLNTLTTQFDGLKTAPRTAIAGRSGQTKTMPTAIQSIMSILRNRLDKQMVMFKKTQPEFYAGYLSARVIIDRGGHSGGASPSPAPQAAPQK